MFGSNHIAESLLSKGLLFSDTLTRGILIVANTVLITDGGDVIPIPEEVPITGGGGGVGLSIDPMYYDNIRDKLKPNQKIKEIRIKLVRQKKHRRFKIDAELIEQQVRAKLIEEKLASDKGFKIDVELQDDGDI